MMFEIVNMDMKIDFVSEALNWEIDLPFMPCVGVWVDAIISYVIWRFFSLLSIA